MSMTILVLLLLARFLEPASVNDVDLQTKSYRTHSIGPAVPSRSGDPLNIKIAVLLPNDSKSQCALFKVLPAIDVGIDEVRSKLHLFREAHFTITYADSESISAGPLKAIDIFNARLASVMLGPVSSFPLASVVRYSTYRYRVPILSAQGFASDLGNKSQYSMLTRLAGTYMGISRVFDQVFSKFKWKPRQHATVVVWLIWHKLDDYECHFQTKPITDRFKQHGMRFVEINDELQVMGYEKFENRISHNLKRIKNLARLTIICSMNSSYVRMIMLEAQKLGLTNGEFVYFNIDLAASQVKGHRPWMVEDSAPNSAANALAQEAYRSLLMITFRLPDTDKYMEFTDKVKNKSEMFYQYTYRKRDATSCVGLFHDAVLLYCLALNDTISQNRSITDGKYVTQRLWNRSFQGVTGEVRIDSNGDGYSDYSLLDMDPNTGDFRVVGTFFGKENELKMKSPIDWVNPQNVPPPDTPRCGYDNQRCSTNSPWLVAVICLVVVTVAAGVIAVIYMKKKYALDLNSMDWKIPWSEIETREMLQGKRSIKESGSTGFTKNSFRGMEYMNFRQKRRKSKKVSQRSDKNSESQSLMLHGSHHRNSDHQPQRREAPSDMSGEVSPTQSRSRRDSTVSNETYAGIQLSQLGQTQMFAKTAIYRGNVVALKPLHIPIKSNININKDTLLEIYTVKNLSNNYIARFIGICIDSGNECIVTEYCPKGSLQDVLENEQIKLDWMFRVSLIQDMCRGMVYLQGSLGYHGNLKSSNCLVDSRFVLKITDHGLPSFRKINQEMIRNDFQYYKNNLWTAPELLRDRNLNPVGLAKSDVYSFAIVCQEIIYRSGVFFISDVEIINPDVVVNNVKAGVSPYFRPRLKVEHDITEDVISLIQSCWNEDPNHRPTFNQIKMRLRRMNNAGDVDILDNLLSRMEQYANNLEGLVKQRTHQYHEEKRKAEDLLYSMLPKSVAGQLIRGEPVTAESFDSVTIYFSDICGFTALSASSTPMEVINLLNALYTLFDSILENYDVYKIETIGDAYMVVSGLPQRNGIMHAKEIANMSIAFLSDIFKFKIPHKTDQQLMMRIGIHTGMVCAGVVGVKMPRYCLFGDTVNTANRMESNGKPLKIHVSHDAKTVLDTFNIFVMTERGNVEMKGKGVQKTYWLHGTKDNIVDRPVIDQGSP